MNAKAEINELKHDAPDGVDIFELLLMREIGLIEEVRELLRVELDGEVWWTSFMDRWFGIGHGGYLSSWGEARPRSCGRAALGSERVAVCIGQALFMLRFRFWHMVATHYLDGFIGLPRQLRDPQQLAS